MEPGFRTLAKPGMEATKAGRFRVAFRFALEPRNVSVHGDGELWAVPVEEQEALREAEIYNLSIYLTDAFGVGFFESTSPYLVAALARLAETQEGDSFLWSFSVIARGGARLDAVAEELEPLAYVGADVEPAAGHHRSLLSCFAARDESTARHAAAPDDWSVEATRWTGDVSDRFGRRRLCFVTECGRADLPTLASWDGKAAFFDARRQRCLQRAGLWDLSLFRAETLVYGFCSADADVATVHDRYVAAADEKFLLDDSEPLEVPRRCYVGADRLRLDVAVVGCGWWAQGWHLPHLDANAETNVVAVVEPNAEAPLSACGGALEPRGVVGARYGCEVFEDLGALIAARAAGVIHVDAVVVAAGHAVHGALAVQALEAGLHVFCEKPLCTGGAAEVALLKRACAAREESCVFMVNHTANFRVRSILAREVITEARLLGDVRHVAADMYAPLSWLFENTRSVAWTRPSTPAMVGNGFMWGQMCHSLAWVFFVTDLEPASVFARRVDAPSTGADVCDTVSVRCTNGAIVTVNGAATIPGESPKSSKLIRNTIVGTDGYLTYSGFDGDFNSGGLVVKRHKPITDMKKSSAQHRDHKKNENDDDDDDDDARSDEVARWRELGFDVDDDGKGLHSTGFEFEDADPKGTGPTSLQSFIDAVLGRPHANCADVHCAAKAVLVVGAAYRSCASGRDEPIDHVDIDDQPPAPPPPSAAHDYNKGAATATTTTTSSSPSSSLDNQRADKNNNIPPPPPAKTTKSTGANNLHERYQGVKLDNDDDEEDEDEESSSDDDDDDA